MRKRAIIFSLMLILVVALFSFASSAELRTSVDFENADDVNILKDKLGNLPDTAFSIVEEKGNHMLKVDTRGTKLYEGMDVISFVFEGIDAKAGQYISFDIKSQIGVVGAIQIFDAADNELGDESIFDGRFYLHTVIPNLTKIVVQVKVDSTFFRFDRWGDFGWILYIDNIQVTDVDPRL